MRLVFFFAQITRKGCPGQGLKKILAEDASARTTLSLGRGRCGRGSADPLWGREGLVNLLEKEKRP